MSAPTAYEIKENTLLQFHILAYKYFQIILLCRSRVEKCEDWWKNNHTHITYMRIGYSESLKILLKVNIIRIYFQLFIIQHATISRFKI
jgi:hypothetical protein